MRERVVSMNPVVGERGSYRLTNVETFVVDDLLDARNNWNPDILTNVETSSEKVAVSHEMGSTALKTPYDTSIVEKENGLQNVSIDISEVTDRIGNLPPHEVFARKLEHLRPMYGDVYRTALAQFPDIDTLKNFKKFNTNNSSQSSYGGWKSAVTGTIYPRITMGEGKVLSVQKHRWTMRIGLDTEWSREGIAHLPDEFWRLYIFAHEIGHAIQRDKKFESMFGTIRTIRGAKDLAHRDYKKYVNSDAETNADYIAMLLVAHSEVGKNFKAPEPSHEPHEWRKWVKEL